MLIIAITLGVIVLVSYVVMAIVFAKMLNLIARQNNVMERMKKDGFTVEPETPEHHRSVDSMAHRQIKSMKEGR